MTNEQPAAQILGSRSAPRVSGTLLVGVLGLIYTCAFVDRTVMSLLVEPIRKDFGLSDTQMSLVVGLAFGTSMTLLTVPAGFVIDRWGRRGLIASAAICWSGMTALCGFAQNFLQLFGCGVGVGIGEACITPASFSLIRDWVPVERRGRAFSIFAIAPYLGNAIALIGGGALMAAAAKGAFSAIPVLGTMRPWQIVLLLLGLIGPLLALLLFLLPRDWRDSEKGGGATDRQGAGPEDFWGHLRAHGRDYLLLIGYVTTAAMLMFGNGAWMPAMISRKWAMPVAEVGYMTGTATLLAGPTGLVICGLVLDRLTAAGRDVRWYGVVAALCGTTAMVAVPIVPSLTTALVLYGVGLFFAGSFYSIGATTLSHMTPTAIMGKVSALYIVAQSLIGATLAPTIVAVISDRLFSGPMALAWALSLFCGLAGTTSLILCATPLLDIRDRRLPTGI